MKKNIFYFIVSIIIFSTSTYSQGFWDISPGPMDYASSNNDTTAENLKSIIRSDSLFQYYGPLALLAYYHGTTERSFILDSMKLYAFQDTARKLSRYYDYQIIRGFLGDPGAFAGLDTCVMLIGMNSERLYAILLLAKNGYYNHFDKVQAALSQKNLTYDAIYCLEAYARYPQYREQCKNLLASVINDANQNGGEVSLAAEKLAKLDKTYASSLLLNRFTTSDFIRRLTIYHSVNDIDPDLKVEISKIALMTEPITNTHYFVPSYYTGIVRDPEEPSGYVAGDSKKFLEPSYVKFLKDFMAQQPPQVAKWNIALFLRDFFPAPETINVLNMLDTLINTKHQVASYGWLGDNIFINELDNHLASARNFLVSGDSLKCAYQIFTFQKKVNEEYRDSLDGDTRSINREGWKFLYYNAEYILERLPGVVTLPSPVNTGWNMISVPVDAANYIKSDLYPNSTSNAFMFSAGYVIKDTLENGIGYWLKFGTNDTLKYKGFPIEIDTIDVVAGWNMIGSISSNIDIAKVKYDPSGIIPSKFFGYNLGYFMADSIKVGKGYWIKVSQSGKIILDKYATAGAGQPPSETPPPPPGSPDIPNLYSPNNGSTGISKTPTLIWFSSIKAQTYRLQVSTNSTFTNLVFDDSTLTVTSKQIGTLANSTTYYWRVNAKNEIWTSDWSSVFWFRTLGIPPPPDPCQPIDAFSALDQFTVSDNSGGKQQLFAHNGGRRLALGLRDYDMPPEPIEGVFHAKFQSGRFVESVPPGKGISKIPIKIKDANFPITINWNIRPESNTKYWLYKSGRDKILLSGVGSTTINSLDGNLLLIEAQAILPDPCY
jgi:hypothetical protein